MYEVNDYHDTMLLVVDCFGNLVQKYVVRESGDNSQLIPLRDLIYSDCYHWVTK
jgi:hypothetical protein